MYLRYSLFDNGFTTLSLQHRKKEKHNKMFIKVQMQPKQMAISYYTMPSRDIW